MDASVLVGITSAKLLHILDILFVESLLSILIGLFHDQWFLHVTINWVWLSLNCLKCIIDYRCLTRWNILVDLALIHSIKLLSDLALSLL